MIANVLVDDVIQVMHNDKGTGKKDIAKAFPAVKGFYLDTPIWNIRTNHKRLRHYLNRQSAVFFIFRNHQHSIERMRVWK